MSVQIHPALMPKETVEEAPVSEVVEEQPSEAQVLETPEAPAAEQEPARRVIDLDSEDLYSQISRYAQEDPRFQNQINSLAGRKAKAAYEPRLTQLQAENARLAQRLQQLEVSNLDEDAIKDRLLRDPNFRQTYGRPPQEAPELIMTRGQIQQAINRIEESVPLAPEDMQPYQQALYEGRFDRDAQGNVLSPYETLSAYQAALYAAANKPKPAAAPPPAVTPPPAAAVEQAPAPPPVAKPQMNTRLAQLNVDLQSGDPQTGAATYKLSEIRRMAPPQRLSLFPDGAALQSAIDKGSVVVDV